MIDLVDTFKPNISSSTDLQLGQWMMPAKPWSLRNNVRGDFWAYKVGRDPNGFLSPTRLYVDIFRFPFLIWGVLFL